MTCKLGRLKMWDYWKFTFSNVQKHTRSPRTVILKQNSASRVAILRNGSIGILSSNAASFLLQIFKIINPFINFKFWRQSAFENQVLQNIRFMFLERQEKKMFLERQTIYVYTGWGKKTPPPLVTTLCLGHFERRPKVMFINIVGQEKAHKTSQCPAP